MLCHNPLSFQGIRGWITFAVTQPIFFTAEGVRENREWGLERGGQDVRYNTM